MYRGRDVYGSIRSRVQALEQANEGLVRERARLESEAAAQEAERARIYRELATMHLPELTQEAVLGTLDEFEGQVQQLLDEKGRDERETAAALADRDRELAALVTERVQVEGLLTEKGDERDGLQARVDAQLEADENYGVLAARVEQAEERVAQDRRRLEAAGREREEKVPAYEADRLFRYLLKRGYGTPRARGNLLTRALDGWVAEKVGFERSRADYLFLQGLPDRLQTVLDEDERRREALEADLDEIEQRLADAGGLTAVLEEGEALEAKRDAFLDRIEIAESDRERLRDRLRDLESTRGDYHRRAVGELEAFLAAQPVGDLRKRAARTGDPRDDALVEALTGVESASERTAEERTGLRARQREVDADLARLAGLEKDFLRRGWNGPRSRFGSKFDLDHLLAAYVAATTDLQGVVSTLGRQHYFVSPPRPSPARFGRRSSRGVRMGGFRAGGFRSGGGFSGGGGFSTGGGF